MTTLPSGAVLVRTWFGGPDADWAALVAAVRTPSEDGFLAYVEPVDDPAFAGLEPAALSGDHGVTFLADETTLTDLDRLIVAAQVPAEEGERPFRVVPGELWSVENNISLANMDWDEFAGNVGPDGVFRGFD